MLSRFFREWGRQIILSSPYLKGAERMVRLSIAIVAVVCGAGVLGALRTAEIPVPWWGYLLVLAAVWWLALTAGIALVTSRIPWVKIEKNFWLDDITFQTSNGIQG